MMTQSDVEMADKAGRRRARITVALTMLFLLQQVAFFASPPGDSVRLVDHVRVGAWAFLSLVMLLFLWTGGMWRYRGAVRELLNDDSARANRANALSLGFMVAMIVALLIYVLAGRFPITLYEAIHLIMSGGIVTAMLRFGFLERRGFA
jgi:hypothetical protein